MQPRVGLRCAADRCWTRSRPYACDGGDGYWVRSGRVYADCAERYVVPIIPLRNNTGHREGSIPRKSDEWWNLYRRRSAVEREFGRLKHH